MASSNRRSPLVRWTFQEWRQTRRQLLAQRKKTARSYIEGLGESRGVKIAQYRETIDDLDRALELHWQHLLTWRRVLLLMFLIVGLCSVVPAGIDVLAGDPDIVLSLEAKELRILVAGSTEFPRIPDLKRLRVSGLETVTQDGEPAEPLSSFAVSAVAGSSERERGRSLWNPGRRRKIPGFAWWPNPATDN